MATSIRVYYADSEIGLYSCALLCQLGYTVIVDRYYEGHRILKKFHHLFVDKTGSMEYDYTFDNEALLNKLIISQRLSLNIQEYIKDDLVEIPEFVSFCIYHWGLTRGDRPLYEFPIYVDRDKIQKWELTPLICGT